MGNICDFFKKKNRYPLGIWGLKQNENAKFYLKTDINKEISKKKQLLK